MAHITVPNGAPGIVGSMMAYPKTAKREPLMTSAWTRLLIVAGVLAGVAIPSGRTGEPNQGSPARKTSATKASHGSVRDWRKMEIVQMLSAILHGSQMGPGEGWFHDSQSRYGWKWLATRYDHDHDGTITRQEFTGPKEFFDRLDRNHDGVLKAGDFDWSDRSPYAMQSMPARMWFSRADTDSNGRISPEEWSALFTRMAQGKGYVTPDDLREAFPIAPPPRPAGSPPPAKDKPSPLTLLRGLLSGELGSFQEGPGIGERAPDFVLWTQDGKELIRLSQYHGVKPVVLIFGSFT